MLRLSPVGQLDLEILAVSPGLRCQLALDLDPCRCHMLEGLNQLEHLAFANFVVAVVSVVAATDHSRLES